VCTLIVLHRCVPGTPLAIGANRDEVFDRPAEGPALREMDFGVIVAPLDVRAGGTWLGLNEYGVFAAVTNRPTEHPDANRRSRGLLVVDALRERNAESAMEMLETLPVDAYNPFNLLVADRESVHAVTYQNKVRPVKLGSGAIVIGNSDPRQVATPKLQRITERASEAASQSSDRTGPEVLDALAEICRSHDGGDDAFRNACVHAGRYGTRSSALIRLGEEPGQGELRYTDAAPCVSEYRDYTALLQELGSCQSEVGASAARSIS
jgi:uncharacterized protein with NRDE domain